MHRVNGLGEATEALAGMVQPGDLVLTLGAGDINRLGLELLAEEPT